MGYGLAVFGFLTNWSQMGKLPAELREQLDAEGVLFIADKVGVSRHFSGHVPGGYSSAGVSRYLGGFGFSAARIVATFPTRGDSSVCGPSTVTGISTTGPRGRASPKKAW